MSRLTEAEIKEYEEEAEYSAEHGSTRHQSPSALDRIKAGARAGARGVATGVRAVGAAREAVDSFNRGEGAGVRAHAQRVNSYDPGFGGHTRPPVTNNIASQPQVEVNQGSVLHPGNKLYVIEGSLLASGGGKRSSEPRRQRRAANPGFGNDPGL
jgi:hypothetical protein